MDNQQRRRNRAHVHDTITNPNEHPARAWLLELLLDTGDPDDLTTRMHQQQTRPWPDPNRWNH